MPFTLPKYEWGTQRELCKRCKHYRPSEDSPRIHSGNLVMRCAVNPYTASKGIGTCIDNRTRGPCGAEGRLFQPKELEWKKEQQSNQNEGVGDRVRNLPSLQRA